MERTTLIKQVVLRMDEITPDAGLSVIVDGAESGSDSNPLYMLVDGVVDDGLIELFSIAPYWRLPQTPFPVADIQIESIPVTNPQYKIIKLRISDNFLRVAEIDCKYFERPITELYSEQSPMGKRQHNTHLRAGVARPVGIMSHGVWTVGNGTIACREIDCYSFPGASNVAATDVVASYIAKPTVSDIPSVLEPALEWLIASRAFGARGDVSHATICQQNAQNLLV